MRRQVSSYTQRSRNKADTNQKWSVKEQREKTTSTTRQVEMRDILFRLISMDFQGALLSGQVQSLFNTLSSGSSFTFNPMSIV